MMNHAPAPSPLPLTPGSHAGHLRGVNRVLLLTQGSNAIQVGRHVLDLSQRWFAVAAPLKLVEVEVNTPSAGVETLQCLIDASEALAAQTLAQTLHNQGLMFERPGEIHLWVVVDLVPTSVDAGAPGFIPVSKPEAPDVCSDLAPSALVQELTNQVWRRLRVAIVPHILFLAEPAAEAALAFWVRQMASEATNGFYVAAPVNQEHLLLETADWRWQVATALAVLLWSCAPNHTLLGPSAMGRGALRALGAAAWPSPAPLLKQWLALQWAHRLATRLINQLKAGAELPASLSPPNANRLEQDLAAAFQPPAVDERWGARRPSWSALADLAQSLARQAEINEKEERMRQQEARFAWLDGQLARWQERLEHHQQSYLSPEEGWPQLGRYRSELHRYRQGLCQAASMVDERLESAVLRHERAGALAEQTTLHLQALCRSFPPCTERGLANAALHPWHWPRWIWNYWQRIPEDARRLLDALAQRRHAAWLESNLQLARQFYLAAIQQTQEELAMLATLEHVLTALAGHLAHLLEQVECELPLPWDPSRLAWLYTQILDDTLEGAWVLLHQHPLRTWPQRAETALATELIAWVEPELAALDHWTTVESLHLALIAGEAEPSVTAGSCWATWLETLRRQATPLWPGQALAQQALAEEWIITPPRPVSQPQPPEAGEGWRHIQDWLAGRTERLQGVGKADGLFALRWVEIT